MKYAVSIFFIIFFICSQSTIGQEKTPISNQAFLQQAELNGMGSVDLCAFAQKKIADKHLQKYASMAHNDYIKANNKLLLLAAKKNIQLFNLTVDTSSAKELNVDKTLLFSSELTPERLKNVFDISFVKMMIEDYQQALSFFESSLNTPDSDVKAFIEECLPVFRKNLVEVTRFTQQALARE